MTTYGFGVEDDSPVMHRYICLVSTQFGQITYWPVTDALWAPLFGISDILILDAWWAWLLFGK